MGFLSIVFFCGDSNMDYFEKDSASGLNHGMTVTNTKFVLCEHCFSFEIGRIVSLRCRAFGFVEKGFFIESTLVEH